MNKMISVIMSVYNATDSLEKSIDSILNQTYEDFEFLICNDASTDDTSKIVMDYQKKDPRIKLFNNKKNIGLTRSLNYLLMQSSGEFIARQDGDDESLENRFQTQIDVLNNLNLDFCTARAYKDNGKITPKLKQLISYKLLIKYLNPFIHGTLMIKSQTLRNIGGYDENFYYAQDYKLFSDLIKNKSKFKVIRQPLYKLNTTNNISSLKSSEQDYYAMCVRKSTVPIKQSNDHE